MVGVEAVVGVGVGVGVEVVVVVEVVVEVEAVVGVGVVVGVERAKEEHLMAVALLQPHPIRERLLLYGDAGCLAGDTMIAINRAGIGKQYRLDDLVFKINGGVSRNGKTWRADVPTMVQREVDGIIRLGRITAAWESGVKSTYTVTTSTGRTVRATDEHPFLTERGWLRLDELGVGDLVHVRGDRSTKGPGPKIRYHNVSRMQHHPFSSPTPRGGARVPVHRLVAEAARNNLNYEVFVTKIMSGDVDGLVFLDPAVWAVHHDNRDSLDNRPENLIVMRHEEHHRLHAHEGTTNNVQLLIAHESVVSIEPHGEEMTYDIEVEDAPHNFLANGFVVHNTGKSNAVCRMILNMPHVRFHIVDSDVDSYWTLLYEDDAFAKVLERGVSEDPDDEAPVTIYPVPSKEWEPQLRLAQQASAACRPGDWYVYDLVTETWSAVQGWHTQQVYGMELTDYFLARRQEVEEAVRDDPKKSRAHFALDGQNDYGKVINPQYNLFYDTFLHCPGNVVMVAEEAPMGGGDGKDKDKGETRMNRNLFKQEGFKPKGQKRIAHVPRTIVHMTADRHSWMYSTVKDRGRDLQEDVEYGKDFSRDYFKRVAGWELKSIELEEA